MDYNKGKKNLSFKQNDHQFKNRTKGGEKSQRFKVKGSDKERKRQHVKKSEQLQNDIAALQARYNAVDYSQIKSFKELPLSKETLEGLKCNDYHEPTEIQRDTIGLALQGYDVLGAAKTGSGKTLAFIIPVLESLYCKRWTHLDGLGALIITPTRELALQIFQTFRSVGRFHDFSAGLVIGGKDLKLEREVLHSVNIVVCTPGRLLQHMDENPLFNANNVQILVLDEADRCLDMGFQKTLDNIIDNLPKERQTLLFSATQTRSIKDLARLSLVNPKYISVHEHEKHRTPEGLVQSYVVCEQEDKIKILWSFIMNHQKHKTLAFFATCNEVRYFTEVFHKLRPPIQVLGLQGKLNQLKRMSIYNHFCDTDRAVLLATDVAARGLDFPAVDWVVQVDCPEDVATYIHRVGRTARYKSSGEALMLVRPTEEPIVEKLKATKVPIDKIEINATKLWFPTAKVEGLLVKLPDLKEKAQRAFVSYVKTIFLMKDKTLFDVRSINTDNFARSLGLVATPRIRFLQKYEKMKQLQEAKNKKETIDTAQVTIKNEIDSESDDEAGPSLKNQMPQIQENFEKFNFSGKTEGDSTSDEDDEVLKVKRVIPVDDDSENPVQPAELISKKALKKLTSKTAIAKRIIKKKIVVNKKIVFDDEGEALLDVKSDKKSELGQRYDQQYSSEGGINIEQAQKVLKEEDQWDKLRHKQALSERKKLAKKKLKEERSGKKVVEVEDSGVQLAGDSSPDLSWLPDPDKVYRNDDDSDKEDDKRWESDDDEAPTKKLKLSVSEDESDQEFTGLSLQDEEQIALKLLNRN